MRVLVESCNLCYRACRLLRISVKHLAHCSKLAVDFGAGDCCKEVQTNREVVGEMTPAKHRTLGYPRGHRESNKPYSPNMASPASTRSSLRSCIVRSAFIAFAAFRSRFVAVI
jgi:hypothetical protein